jgi:antitoxin (DNA-binding transcriptional repressor) of toxin-antitoxin stability system
MAASDWKVPRPSGVISSRDLARNTSNLLTELKESEHSLLIVRHGLPTAVISSIPDPSWRPRRSVAEIELGRSDEPNEAEVETDDEVALEVLEGLELSPKTLTKGQAANPAQKTGLNTHLSHVPKGGRVRCRFRR